MVDTEEASNKGLESGGLKGASPGSKKLKQTRLPFAPVNKSVSKQAEAERKRKHSDENQSEPKKLVKLSQQAELQPVILTSNQSQGNSTEDKNNLESSVQDPPAPAPAISTQKEEKENVKVGRQVKPKKSKRKLEEVISIDDEVSLQDRPDNVTGKVKLAFKKNKDRKSTENKDDDFDLDILEDMGADAVNVDTSEQTTVTDEKMNVSEDKSMTDEWAEFHQKELEKGPIEAPPPAIEKLVTPKSEKKKIGKNTSPSEGKKVELSATTEFEPIPSTSKVDPYAKETVPVAKPEEVKPKVNPLAKFLVKMSPGAIKPKKVQTPKSSKPKAEIPVINDSNPTESKTIEKSSSDDVVMVEEVTAQKPDLSLAIDSAKLKFNESEGCDQEIVEVSDSPVKVSGTPVKVSGTPVTVTGTPVTVSGTPVTASGTPVTVSGTPVTVSGTPVTDSKSVQKSTPASVRAKQMAVTKLKVTIQELLINIDEAVGKADFLKAHELKQKQASVEAEIVKLEADQEFVAFSPSIQNIMSAQKNDVTSSSSSPASSNDKASISTSTPNAGGSAFSKTPNSSQTKKARSIVKVTTPGSCDTTPKTAKTLTPKQQALADERRKKQQLIEEEKEKKRKQKELEKQDKDRQKEIDKRMKEIAQIERERQKREKDRLKEEEKLRKKEEKDAEAQKKEEERLAAEEAKRKAMELENEKKKKAAAAFKGFFVKKETAKPVVETTEEKMEIPIENGHQFNPFQVKQNMRLAPICRADPLLAKNSLDALDGPCGPQELYLQLMKSGSNVARSQGKTWPRTKGEEDEVQLIEDEDDEIEDLEEKYSGDDAIIKLRNQEAKQHKAKLLQFHDNQRPAYWGTWRKKSTQVTARKPFGQDNKMFDYDYDSDEDWEDEGEGESLSDADDEKEEEDEYEVDNEFFVPHGYLSDGEEDKDEDEVFNPELEKEKLKLKEKEFEKEIKKKTQQLKPRLWGCFWQPETMDTETAALQLVKVLSGYAAVPCGNNNIVIPTAISHPDTCPALPLKDDSTESAREKMKVRVSKIFPEEGLVDLVKLTHMNINNKIFLAREFIQFWSGKTCSSEPSHEDDGVSVSLAGTAAESADNCTNSTPSAKQSTATPRCGATPSVDAVSGATPSSATPSGETPSAIETPSASTLSKKKVVAKIQEIADYKKVDGRTGKFWVVKPEILAKVQIENVDTNTWTYILEQPNNQTNNQPSGQVVTSTSVSTSTSRPVSPVNSKLSLVSPAQLITKFTKVLSEDERANLANNQPRPGPTTKKVNKIQVKSKPNSSASTPSQAQKGTKPAVTVPNGPINKIPIKRKADAKMPVNMINVKKAATTPSVIAVNKIAIKKSPFVKNDGANKSKDALVALKSLSGISVAKVHESAAAASNNDEECITLD